MTTLELVRDLIESYSPERFRKVIASACAPATFVPVTGKTIDPGAALPKVDLLGVVRDLPGDTGLSAPLLVADVPLGDKPLTERSSRIAQFKVARKTLEQVCLNPPVPVEGVIVQGVFAFHDANGNFRVSLVTARAEKGKLVWNSAKRQSFYVTPGGGNATFIQRMTMAWSSLAAIKEAFSVERLTKQFYNEIQNWYFWAQLEDQHVSFPNDIEDDTDDAKFNGENLIRLITRMVFTWFLKEKKLVNPELFDPAFLKTALVNFDPEAAVADPDSPALDRNCNYYRAILQNLFFATFNQEIKRRQFLDDGVLDKKRRGVKNYFRNAKLFAENDPKKILAYFNASPFVNGGLFECLDGVVQEDKNTGREKVYSWDGFSNNLREHGQLKSAVIPNRLFFCEETTCDLSSVLEGKSAKNVKVRGLIRILESYNFTIEENSPSDEEVALDPELLGKVFENLLGCFNPETQKMARNSTGSFYTPREEVNYMVGESLVAYLMRAVPAIPEMEIRELVAGGAELEKLPTVKSNVKPVLAALFRMKLLDPACGSGAFPMGAMLAVVGMLRTLDPENELWRKVVLEESKKAIADIADDCEREAVLSDIERSFDEKLRYPDYARKLYVIEHCIFGSDIQPIAVQISRLRFFISLLCEQRKTDVAAENYGVTPLPNLENNFVAANSLLSIDLKDIRELLKRQKVAKLVRELRETRHRLFLPKTAQQKADLKEKDRKLCDKIDEAARAAYDEHTAGKIAYYKKELEATLAIKASLSSAELAKPVSEISLKQGELFGDDEKQVSGRITKGQQLDKRIKEYEKAIAAIGTADLKRVLLDNIRRLVKWNPFAFNVAEDFLDPEWMFGVKDGFDIVIANPPYIKEYENKHAFDGFREQSPYYVAKMDLWYGFACIGLDMLKDLGILCFIAQNNWTTSAGAIKMRNKITAEAKMRQLVDFNEHMVFASAQIQTMIMLIEKDETDDSFVIDYRSLKTGATDENVSKIFAREQSDDVVYLLPTLKRSANVDSFLPILGNGLLLDKIEAKSNFKFADHEIVQGIIGNPDEAFKIGDDELSQLNDKELCFVRKFYTHTDRYYTAPSNENVIYLSQKSTPGFSLDLYPGIKNRLIPYSSHLKSRREVQNGKLVWHFMHWPRVESVFVEGAKIVWAARTVGRNFTYTEDAFFGSRNLFYLETSRINLKYLVAIFNSKLLRYYMDSRLKHLGAMLQLDKNQIVKVPVFNDTGTSAGEIVLRVDKILAAKKANPSADTSQLEHEIDEIVYDLYGLTAEERAIVEKSCEKPEKAAKKPAATLKTVKEKKPKTPTFEEEF